MAAVNPPVIVTSDGRFEYAMTEEDIVVMARSIRKESMTDKAAIAWCYVQRYVMLRQRGWQGSFAKMVTYFSQPINPDWFPDGKFCRPGGQYAGTQSCASAASRPGNASVPWSAIEPSLKDFLADWSDNQVPNEVPRVVDFRARDAETERIRSGQSSRDLTYFPADTRNAFFTTSTSERWPDGYVQLKRSIGYMLGYVALVVGASGLLVATTALSRRR